MLREDYLRVGGMDESMWTWEDTDFFMKCAANGICGARCPEPLTMYRYTTGQLRERGFEQTDELKALMRSRYSDFMEGKDVACGCGSANGVVIDESTLPTQGIRVQYNGPVGAHEVIGVATKKSYGRRQRGDIFYIFAEDYRSTPNRFSPVVDKTELVKPTMIPEAPRQWA
jgi:hypothetical protein